MKWNEISIGDLGEVITGNTPLTTDREFYGGVYPFIKPTDMEIGMRHVTKWEENYSEKAFKKYKKAYIPPGSTGVVTIGTVGEKIFQADQFCFTNQSVNVVIPDRTKYDPDFVYYLLKHNLPKVSSANPGTASGRHHVSKSNFCSIKLLVPAHKEVQEKIGAILSTYDDLIENNIKRVKLLKELAERTYDEWFNKFRVNGKRLKLAGGTDLPRGWSKISLGEAAEFVSRGISPKYVDEAGITVINQKCIRDGAISLSQSRFTSIHTKFAKEKYLQLYDVVVNSTGAGTLGRVALVTSLNKDVTVDTHVSIVRADKMIISPILLGYAIKSQEALITSLGKGSTNQLELSRNDLKDLVEIIVPDSNTQKEFDLIVEPVLQLISNLSNQNIYLREVRDILLPRLMNGTIDVSEITGQPELTAENQAWNLT
ncbi:restriction endonuclease subunit S [Fulvivirgaceae bacterium PWU4]|uniref:Restriction endonuclease subunit S n=1 Tax=Chryseosolibacter histidini TaxID=2782349 RepID=A0AAP2DSF5_9BACT|nr:restriction endonuclease subunit S [Chryseosolibacter histidini]MBT1699629.1 restriction endonuclease subunit S [Chryseosolibacter histidini]